MNENDISYLIRKSIFTVYNELGPGLLEKIYEKALAYELILNELQVKTQVPIPVMYKKVDMEVGLVADIVVENKVIIEIKSVEELSKVHHKQILTYLKLTKMKLGILVNFNTDQIDKDIYRKINGYIE
ncbi:MAG: GxxExxY protein [Flavobacteriaceae bacterium]|jgi:GxxExxY protein|nr:GxxExxY protein [Flavobacteriaceae bacterium]